MGSEKFCLRWNDFENNISSAFKELRDDKDFFDVTLACDDEQIHAHKVILAACSPFFRNVLRRNPHQNPLLYLKGVKYTDLQSVLNFMYHGEVNVAQEELNSFLAVAEDLRVKGLTQGQSESQKKREKDFSSRPKSPIITNPNLPRQNSEQNFQPPKPRSRPANPPPVHHQPTPEDDVQEVVPIKSEPRDPAPAHNVYQQPPASVQEHSLATYQEEEVGYEDYGGMEQYETLDQQYDMNQPMQGAEQGKEAEVKNPEDLLKFVVCGGDGGVMCSLCAKTFKNKRDARNHIESIHFPNSFIYSCEHCGKQFNALNTKNVHVTRNHSKKTLKPAVYSYDAL